MAAGWAVEAENHPGDSSRLSDRALTRVDGIGSRRYAELAVELAVWVGREPVQNRRARQGVPGPGREHERTSTAEAWARQAIRFARHRFRADSWIASLAHLGLALASVAHNGTSRRGRARGCAANVYDARRSQPSVTRTPCSCSRRSASLAPGWRAVPATSSARKGRSRISRSRAATSDRSHRRAGPHHRPSECRKP